MVRAMWFTALFYLFFLITLPKEQIFYEAQRVLREHGFLLGFKELKESFLGLDAKKGYLKSDGSELADIGAGSAKVFLFYNSLEFEKVDLKLPQRVEIGELRLIYSVADPFKVAVEAKIEGVCDVRGVYELKSGILSLAIVDVKNPAIVKSLFWGVKKDKDGNYLFRQKI